MDVYQLKHSSLREKCPNMEVLLVRIFLYLDWIRRFTPQSKYLFLVHIYGPEITSYLGTFHVVSVKQLILHNKDSETLFLEKTSPFEKMVNSRHM